MPLPSRGRPALRPAGPDRLDDRLNPAPYTLQLLHASDFEAGIAAVQDAPRFAAIVDRLEDQSPTGNSITLSSGDNYIPGPFFNAGGDPSLNAVLGTASVGRPDIEILNRIGVQASTLGNHEFDAGPREVLNIIAPAGGGAAAWRGAQFPYLSSNLTFNGGDLGPRVVAAGKNVADITPGRISPSVVVTENGYDVGVIGLTTPLLDNISSPGPNIVVNPTNDVNPPDAATLDALAGFVQAEVARLTGQGVNLIVLASHLQDLNIERALAPRLSGVDVIIGGGSNTRLADATDVLRPGDTAADTYPLTFTGADGNPILLVNTDGNFKYVGRLVFTVDTDTGVIDPASLDPAVNGAYATDQAGLDRVYAGSGQDPFAPGGRGAAVRDVAQAVGNVIGAKDGEVFGQASVYLNGLRAEVRTEETNLGSVTADANLFAARQAGQAAVVSVKNGGGIRDSIGSVDVTGARAPTAANPPAGKAAGQVSRLDVENSLRFNNALTVVSVPASGLRQVLEHAVAAVAPGATPGQFGQFGGVRFSFDPARTAQVLQGDTTDGIANVVTPGQRVRNAAIIDESGAVVEELVRDGALVGDPARLFRIVTLNFLADEGATVDGLGGDNYPIPSFDSGRVDLVDPQGNRLGEQQGLIDYLRARFPAGGPAALDLADTPAGRDGRIQNLAARTAAGLADTVFTGAAAPVVPATVTTAEDTPTAPIVLAPNTANGAEVAFFRVTGVTGGALFLADGTTPLPADGLVTPAQGAAGLVFRPDADFAGTGGFQVQAAVSNTAAGAGPAAPVTVTVTPVNDLPVAAAVTLTTAEDTAVSGAVAATDADGNLLAYTLAAGPAGGAAVVRPGGTFAYTPAADFAGTDTFTVTVADGSGGTATVTVTVSVTPVNDPPTAAAVTRTTREDAALTGAVTAADADGDALTFTLAAGPAGGAVTVAADGTFVYTPAADFNGTDRFVVAVSDANGGTATTTVTVVVTPENDPPAASDSAVTTAEDAPVAGVIAATDRDGDRLTYTLTAGPASGTVVVSPAGTFVYTPAADFSGTDRFVVSAGDGSGGTATAAVTVTVTAENDPPAAAGDVYLAPAGGPLTVAAPGLLGNDRDAEGTALTAVLVAGPAAAQGTLTLNPDGSFTFTPAAGFAGVATFTYAASDGDLASPPATVSVAVPPAAPTVPPPPPPAGEPRDQGEVGVFAAASGTDGLVVLFDPTGTELRRLRAFTAAEAPGGVRAAAADFTGDGTPDVAVGTGPGVATRVRVFDGATGQLLNTVSPFEESFTGGVNLAAADFDGDGAVELVVSADNGGGPRVRVLSGDGRTVRADFFGIEDPAFRGGARVAAGDVNGDGTPDLVVAAGFGGGPRVALFDGRRLFLPVPAGGLPAKLRGDFFVFEDTLRDGAFVTAGDLDGDGAADVVGAGGPGGGPRVFGLSGAGLVAGRQDPVANFFAGDPADRSGLRLAAKDLDGDDRADLVVAPGTAGQVRAFRGRDVTASGSPQPAEDLFPFGEDFVGGAFVG